MKKSLIYALGMAAGMLLCACNEKTEAPDMKALAVTKAEVSFEAPAAVGTIETGGDFDVVSAVSSHADWCTVTPKGKSVSVSVTDNVNAEGRHAIVTITDADENTVEVPVNQKGNVWMVNFSESELTFDYGEHTFDVPVVSSLDYSVETPDWISYEKTEEGLTFTVAAATTLARRDAVLKIIGTLGTVEITVIQYEPKKIDITGTYNATWRCYDSDSPDPNNPDTIDGSGVVRIVEDDSQPNRYWLKDLSSFAGIEFNIPLNFDPYTFSISVPNAYYLDAYGTSYYFFTVFIFDNGMGSVDTSLKYTAQGTYDEATNALSFTFEDKVGIDNEGSRIYISGFDVYAFASKVASFDASNIRGYVGMFENLKLERQ